MSKQCVNCPGAVDHSTAECPVMCEATGPIDPIHSAMMLGMNLLNLRNHVPGSDVDLCVKALVDLLEGKHSPAPEPSEAWREVAAVAQAGAPADHSARNLNMVAQPAVTQCDHQWTDDGQHLLICTACGAQENHDPKWRDMATAPRDGTIVRLLVEFTEHATEDADQAPTIGANNFENDGDDRWQFAGWCWSHDHFTEGKGEPVGWLPMLDEPRRIAGDQQGQQS